MRRKGRMLVPKLDYLQYVLVKQVITTVGSKLIGLYHTARGSSPEAEQQVSRWLWA